MSEKFVGKVEVSDGTAVTIVLNGDVKPQKQTLGQMKAGKDAGTQGTANTGSSPGSVLARGMGIIELRDTSGESNLMLNGDGTIAVGGVGRIDVGDRSSKGLAPIELNSTERTVSLNAKGGIGIHLKADSATTGGEIRIGSDLHAIGATLRLGAPEGGRGENGTLFLCDTRGVDVLSLKAQPGAMEIRSRGHLHATGATLRLGRGEDEAKGDSGVLFLCNDAGKLVLSLKADKSEIVLRNTSGKETVRLDGQAGDIFLGNADCAEEFEVADPEGVEPGSVMILDDDGRLEPGHKAYDKRVAGVISGAGGYRPGIVLDSRPAKGNRMPVALMGKVYCRVDASHSSIEVGDLLTTSDTPGHAMKAADPARAFGSVIGKALRPLASGTGLIPILIALQ